MKRQIGLLLLVMAMSGCNSTTYDSSDETSSTVENVFDEDMYYKEEVIENNYFESSNEFSSSNEEITTSFKSVYEDSKNGVNVDNVKYGELFLNGKLQDSLTTAYTANHDAKYVFYTPTHARVISRSEAYAITIPTDKILKTDFSKAQYKSIYETSQSTITISSESSNPYSTFEKYNDSWLSEYIRSQSFLNANDLSYTREMARDTTSISGYQIDKYDIVINDNENIEKPYYNIAVIREVTSQKHFKLLVMKSKTNCNEVFDSIVSSFSALTSFGKKIGKQDYDLKVPSYWSKETQLYYKQLLEQQYTGWGIFKTSMTDSEQTISSIRFSNSSFEQDMDYKFDIIPTYTHLNGMAGRQTFPLKAAQELCGGNGFNDKPVIQFTLQFTTTNNTSLEGYTPMYDIMRGEYDDYFKEMAGELKQYGKPVLFRLNNEMNSDWVSYCGMVTLLDSDIFINTWERMAQIFKDEGVDNVIYIFNPTAISCPYSSWGEDICYLPSLEFVNVLGLTYYEPNNYTNGEFPVSFAELYTELYEKNKPYFKQYPAIISEFACGAGGSSSGTAFRNHVSQAVWVEEMFSLLNSREGDYLEFVRQIKAAIWFSVDDSSGSQSLNCYGLSPTFNTETYQAFKEGLDETEKLKKGN